MEAPVKISRPPLLRAILKGVKYQVMWMPCNEDQSESTLVGTTRGIELGGMINIPWDATQSDARRNGFWSRPIIAGRGKKKNVRVAEGMFHQFCDEIQFFLLMWAWRIPMNKTQ